MSWAYRARRRPKPASDEHTSIRARPCGHARGGAAAGRRRRRSRRHARASALRVSAAQAPFRALHARDGRARLRRRARAVPARRRRLLLARRAPRRPARSATPSDGRSTRPACRSSARRAILQLLLGNIGRPGGGILALRGHASIQGSTDIPTLYDILPGYLPMPSFEARTRTRSTTYIRQAHGARSGWWHNFDKYIVSLLKAWYGEAATAANEFGYGWLPRVDRRPLAFGLLARDGRRRSSKGCSSWARTRRSARRTRGSSAARWRSSTGSSSATWSRSETASVLVRLAGGRARRAAHRRDRDRGVPLAGGGACGEGRHVHEHAAAAAVAREGGRAAGRRPQRDLVRLSPRAPAEGARRRAIRVRRNAGLNALTWNYRDAGGARASPKSRRCCRRSTAGRRRGRSRSSPGYHGPQERRIDGMRLLDLLRCLSRGRTQPARTSASRGTASATAGDSPGPPTAASSTTAPRRGPTATRGASARSSSGGTEAPAQWTGLDVPDFTRKQAARLRAAARRGSGDDALPGDAPFLLHQDGLGWIWVPGGLKDGPLPAHYEPLESPFEQRGVPRAASNPAADAKERPDNPYARRRAIRASRTC